MVNKKLTMCVLKGASGTGKGTRVSQLLEYMKTLDTPVMFRSRLSSKLDAGLLFPKLGFLFIGGFVKSNKSGLTSWTSMDNVHATLKTAEAGRELIKEAIEFLKSRAIVDDVTIVLEGEPMLLSDKFRPEFIESEYKPERLYISYFMYSDREQYDKRIIGRSGGTGGGDSGWSRASSYLSDFEKSKEEATRLDYTQCSISLRSFDEEVWRWGSDILYAKTTFDTSLFTQWAIDNPTLRTVGGADPLSKTKKLWG